MRRELGKWLMDIAKYMTTALLLASVFSKLEGVATYTSVVIATILTLVGGLWLFNDKKEKEDKK